MSWEALDNIADTKDIDKAVSTGKRLPTEKLRANSINSKEAHNLFINNLDALGLAKYLTEDNPNNMINSKRLKEIKSYVKKNKSLKTKYDIVMKVLSIRNDIDTYTEHTNSNIIDGLAL